MVDPSGIDDDLREAAHRHFTSAQVVEITLDVLAFSKQKVTVGLAVDAPVDPARLTPLAFDERGFSVIG